MSKLSSCLLGDYRSYYSLLFIQSSVFSVSASFSNPKPKGSMRSPRFELILKKKVLFKAADRECKYLIFTAVGPQREAVFRLLSVFIFLVCAGLWECYTYVATFAHRCHLYNKQQPILSLWIFHPLLVFFWFFCCFFYVSACNCCDSLELDY